MAVDVRSRKRARLTDPGKQPDGRLPLDRRHRLVPELLDLDAGLVVLPRAVSGDDHLPLAYLLERAMPTLEDEAVATDEEVLAGVVPTAHVHVKVLDRVGIGGCLGVALAVRCSKRMPGGVVENRTYRLGAHEFDRVMRLPGAPLNRGNNPERHRTLHGSSLATATPANKPNVSPL